MTEFKSVFHLLVDKLSDNCITCEWAEGRQQGVVVTS